MRSFWSQKISNRLPALPKIETATFNQHFGDVSIKIIKHKDTSVLNSFCGGDLGLHTFLTTFSPTMSVYYEQNRNKSIKQLNLNNLYRTVIDHMLDLNDTVFLGDLEMSDSYIDNYRFNIFKKLLINESIKRNKNVHLIPEHFTTRTCSKCGLLKFMGPSRIFKCDCGFIACRDLNAAKNILIRGIITTNQVVVSYV